MLGAAVLGHIAANPDLQADHCRGVIVGQYGILYEAFDDTVASGSEGYKDYSPKKSMKQSNLMRALARHVLINTSP